MLGIIMTTVKAMYVQDFRDLNLVLDIKQVLIRILAVYKASQQDFFFRFFKKILYAELR